MLTREQARELVQSVSFGDFVVISDEIDGKTRWEIIHNVVFKDRRDDQLYRTYYTNGATEHQDIEPFEDDDPVIKKMSHLEVKAFKAVRILQNINQRDLPEKAAERLIAESIEILQEGEK
jgi:hypothetical protein